jgi:hypothetical protein
MSSVQAIVIIASLFTLWHVQSDEHGIAQRAKSWDLIEGTLSTVLQRLPADVSGLGCSENGFIWLVILMTHPPSVNAPDIEAVLRETAIALVDHTHQSI